MQGIVRTGVRLLLLIIFVSGIGFLHPMYAQDNQKMIVYGAEIDTTQLPTIQYTFNMINTNGIDEQPLDPATLQKAISLNVNNDPTSIAPLAEPKRQILPLAVAFVLDTSVMMDERNSPPNSSRLQDASENINTLLRKLPDGSQFSLITFDSSATTLVSKEKDKNVIRNQIISLQRTNIVSDQYAISEGIKLGLAELQNQAHMPLALFVLTSGKPEVDIDGREASNMLSSMADNPPAITVISYGSDQAGQYQTYPANLGSLERLIISLQAANVRFFALDNQQLLSSADALDQRISTILQRATYYIVQFAVNSVKSGENTFTLNVANTISTRTVEVGSFAPKIALDVPTTLLSGTIPLKTTIVFSQYPIEKIEYFLNNSRIGESKTASDQFVYNFDTTTAKQFSPNKAYELVAAATYTEAGSTKTVRSSVMTVQLAAPVVVAAPKRTIPWALIGAGVAGVLGLSLLTWGLMRFRRKPIKQTTSSASLPPRQHSDPDMTIDVAQTPSAPEDQTKDFFRNDETQDFFATTRLPTLYKIILRINGAVIVNEPLRKYITTIGRTEGNDIVIQSPHVSREHAQIIVDNDMLYVIDRKSTNGVFLQERQPVIKSEGIPVNEKVRLDIDQPFWIGTQVEAIIQTM